ncbi:hypothetical protein B0H17DRAFT_1085921 [Mycena rosella]|uniref:F-box domain-containing protein n=1 Tax=Mycena rosella TaxID=1033263 RepID=A0AAD7G660_MYCRO|nr:hypothetical protein B0H17DRAFT_1085921 [Mycena rosella]
MNSRESPASLPPEVWIYIQRLATSEASPLTLAVRDADRFQYVPLADPFKDVQEFLRNACSFVLVCRLWNSLANELLYENVQVDDGFQALYASLERPGNSYLVRSIRLSTIRFDHNSQILALCPRVQIIVQPDVSNSDIGATLALPLEPLRQMDLPTFHFLRHIYCTELLLNSGLLSRVLAASRHLESLFVYPMEQSMDLLVSHFPAIPSLKRLGFHRVVHGTVLTLLQMDLQGLTRLQCSPSTLSLAEFRALPSLPSLHTLDIFGSRSTIPFPTIFSRCPRLRELSYDVWNDASPPQDEKTSLSCIRLHSAVTVVRDWIPIERHFGLFISNEFPRLQRLVLCGTWHRVVADAQFARFRDGLRELGCRLEFPEGSVLS